MLSSEASGRSAALAPPSTSLTTFTLRYPKFFIPGPSTYPTEYGTPMASLWTRVRPCVTSHRFRDCLLEEAAVRTLGSRIGRVGALAFSIATFAACGDNGVTTPDAAPD